MNFDFNIYRYNYNDRDDMLVKDATGIVKCRKEFPIYKEDGKEYLFKPLSKTKPLTTPLFAYSEVFWSTIIRNYFDELSPLYRLAICGGYEKEHPSRYSKGTIVESITKNGESLVNLLEYYIDNPDELVDIKDYINYCGVYYDYTTILNSNFFNENNKFGCELAKQVLISILKNDINYHYENVAFITENGEIKTIAPPFDHEFSVPFLYPDDLFMSATYLGSYNMTMIENSASNSNVNLKAILKNIKLIAKKYPELTREFLGNLDLFINDFISTDFTIPSDFIEPFSTELYQVYEAIYKEHKDSKKIHEISKFKLHNLDMEEYSKTIKNSVVMSAINYYNNLSNNLDRIYVLKK